MKRWLTLPIVGSATAADPRRPDLMSVVGLRGYSVAVYGATECLVLVAEDPTAIDELTGKPGVGMVADRPQAVEVHDEASLDAVAAAREAAIAEARRLGAPEAWVPTGTDVPE